MLLLLIPAVAQEPKSEIRGSVVDMRHEPISASQVVIRGPGIERKTQSDDAGLYRFIALPPGDYELTITAPVFYIPTIRAVHSQANAVHVLPPVEMVFDGPDCNTRVPAYLSPLDRSDPETDLTLRKGALGGIIVDDHGQALSEARVRLFVAGAGVISSTITNREGRFSLKDLPLRRDYQLEVVHDGYFTEEFTDFTLQAGFEAAYDRLYLEPCEKGRCQPSLRPIRMLRGCA